LRIDDVAEVETVYRGGGAFSESASSLSELEDGSVTIVGGVDRPFDMPEFSSREELLPENLELWVDNRRKRNTNPSGAFILVVTPDGRFMADMTFPDQFFGALMAVTSAGADTLIAVGTRTGGDLWIVAFSVKPAR